MTTTQGTTYTVEAYNLSHASENKIHDDAVARKLGFSGGLCPASRSTRMPVTPLCAAGETIGWGGDRWSAASSSRSTMAEWRW